MLHRGGMFDFCYSNVFVPEMMAAMFVIEFNAIRRHYREIFDRSFAMKCCVSFCNSLIIKEKRLMVKPWHGIVRKS